MFFYKMEAENAVFNLKSSVSEGLDKKEWERRLQKFGKNSLPRQEKYSLWELLFTQFKDFMILVLLVAALVSAIMGHTDDAFTILAIVLLNGILGFIQEYRAEKSLEALEKLNAPRARVIRGGSCHLIDSTELVPGDIILLEAGDRIAADGRLVEVQGLETEEAILTGESLPVAKKTGEIEEEVALGNQDNMVFSGCLVTRGSGKALITATGENTEIGKIAVSLKKRETKLTPLQKRLKLIGQWLVALCFLACLFVVIIGLWKGEPLYQMVLAGISLAVAAIPEGLPAVVTLSLAIGVQRMIKKEAIIRKLPAVETMGCATFICVDKTGTVTENSMVVAEIFSKGRSWKPEEFAATDLKDLWFIAGLCNQARLELKDGKVGFFGDPTDGALLVGAWNSGIKPEKILSEYDKVELTPFSSETKMMSWRGEKEGREIFLIKGAPEVILPLCSLERDELETVDKKIQEMAEQGLRLIALARKKDSEIILEGIAALRDPPRPEVKEAVNRCHEAGIKVLMITGDHPATAQKIAREVGILKNGEVWTGSDLKSKTETELHRKLPGVNVISRVDPEDKLKVIRTLRRLGEVVAMTGDGINDAPAVKEADIGVAMGRRGTEVTREAAALVLGDDNFATIVRAIEEGREIYANIKKFLKYLLSCNIGEIMAVILAMVFGLPIPLLPTQILWVNLVTDGLPALALGMSKSEENLMQNSPREPKESVFAGGMAWKIAVQGSSIGVITLLAFWWALENHSLSVARSFAFTALVLSQLFFSINCVSENRFFWQENWFKNKYLLGAVSISLGMHFLALYWAPLQKVFSSVPLSGSAWLFVLHLSLFPLILAEIIQLFQKKVRID